MSNGDVIEYESPNRLKLVRVSDHAYRLVIYTAKNGFSIRMAASRDNALAITMLIDTNWIEFLKLREE